MGKCFVVSLPTACGMHSSPLHRLPNPLSWACRRPGGGVGPPRSGTRLHGESHHKSACLAVPQEQRLEHERSMFVTSIMLLSARTALTGDVQFSIVMSG